MKCMITKVPHKDQSEVDLDLSLVELHTFILVLEFKYNLQLWEIGLNAYQ